MRMFSRTLERLAEEVLDGCRADALRLAVAESCTGGLIAGCLTAIAGASEVLECGFVTYSNASKTAMLGVPEKLIEAHGAVSEEVALAMAEGALERSAADVAVAVTGTAGPGGGGPEKAVGTVFVATALRGRGTACRRHLFTGDRARVRAQTVEAALGMIGERIA